MKRVGQALIVVLATSLVGSDCEGVVVEDERRFRVSFFDTGPNTETIWRSQEQPEVHEWDGSPDLHYLQLLASPPVSALVQPPEGAGFFEPTFVFLDAPGQWADTTGKVESTNEFGQRMVPGIYDVFVAPGSLLDGQAAARFVDVTLNDETPDWVWQLPTTVDVVGDVEAGGTGIEGPWIIPYPRDFGDMPLGPWAEALDESALAGEGSFSVPIREGIYDVVVAPPLRIQDNGVLQPDPIPPTRLDGRRWPIEPVLDPPLREGIDLPVLPVTSVVGRVRAAGEDVTAVSRIRVEGTIPSGNIGGEDYDGGLWIADLRTDGDGAFRVDVPQGSYTVTATPPFTARDRDVGIATFEALGGEILDVDVGLSSAAVATISVVDEEGAPVPDAGLFIRNAGPPRYAYGERTQSEGEANPGFWFGTLMRGTYEVEVIPPVDPETENKRWARAHGVLQVGFGGGGVIIQLRRSAFMNGLVFSVDQRPVADILVQIRDPETGLVVDEAATNRTNEHGFFRAILPETE